MKKITLSTEYGVKTDWNKLDDWQKKAHPYTVTLKYDRRQMTIPFFMGPALTNEPTEEDVIPCLISDYYAADYAFEDFCNEFGYDTDSRNAEKIYKQIQQQNKKFSKLLGPDLDKVIEKYQDM